MKLDTAAKIHRVMAEIATAVHELVTLDGGEPLHQALVTVLSRIDELVVALPEADGQAELPPHPQVLHGVTEPRGCAVPVRLARDEAEKLSQVVVGLSRRVNETIVWVQTDGDEAVLNAYRRLAGRVMGYMYTELLQPLWHQHRELEPREG